VLLPAIDWRARSLALLGRIVVVSDESAQLGCPSVIAQGIRRVPLSPTHICLREYLATGVLGPVRLGCSRYAVVEHFGKPDTWFGREPWQQSMIWRYGDLELHFGSTMDDRLWRIFSDHLDWSRPSAGINVDPWILRAELSIEVALKRCRGEAFRPILSSPPGLPEFRDLILQSGILLRFASHGRQSDDTFLLGSFWSSGDEPG
jgi:hypothetical protein